MKVALMTCYMNNFGACLQAYALQTVIRELGNDCDIIRYTPIPSVKEYPLWFRAAYTIRNRLKGIRNFKFRYENYRLNYYKAFKREYLIFNDTYYPTIASLYQNPPEYDAFVTGSDQVWNPLIHENTNNKAYFLDFVPQGKKRIAYAPSIGLSELPAECGEEMGQLIDRFDTVSVRETAGKKIIEKISKKECRVVLDPTLLLTREQWLKITKKPSVQKPYILCYLFSE